MVEAAGPRALLRLAAARPVVPVAAAGVVVLAAALVLLIHPVLTPVLLGYTLFALHVVAAVAGQNQAEGRQPIERSGPHLRCAVPDDPGRRCVVVWPARSPCTPRPGVVAPRRPPPSRPRTRA